MSCCRGAEGFNLVSRSLYPEGLMDERVLPKPLSVVNATIVGVIKTLLFPLWALVGAIGFLFSAAREYYHGRDAGPHLEASVICLAGFLGSVAFFVLAVNAPIIVAAFFVLAAMAISISIHVHRAAISN